MAPTLSVFAFILPAVSHLTPRARGIAYPIRAVLLPAKGKAGAGIMLDAAWGRLSDRRAACRFSRDCWVRWFPRLVGILRRAQLWRSFCC